MVQTDFPQITFSLDSKVLRLHFQHLHLPLDLDFFHFILLVLLPQVIGLFPHVNLLHAGHRYVLISKVHSLLFLEMGLHLVFVHLILQSTEF